MDLKIVVIFGINFLPSAMGIYPLLRFSKSMLGTISYPPMRRELPILPHIVAFLPFSCPIPLSSHPLTLLLSFGIGGGYNNDRVAGIISHGNFSSYESISNVYPFRHLERLLNVPWIAPHYWRFRELVG